MRKSNIFIDVTSEVFHQLIGYSVGDVREDKSGTFVRFDKQIDNVIVSRDLSFSDDGIHESVDYVLDTLPEETDQ